MRRLIVGAVLVAVLGFVIYRVWSTPRKVFDERNRAAAANRSSRSGETEGVNDSENAGDSTGTGDSTGAGDSEGAGDGRANDLADANFAPNGEPVRTVDLPDLRVLSVDDVEEREADIISHDPLLVNGTVDELTQKIINLSDAWPGKEPSIVFLMNKRRAVLARHLLGMEADEYQKIFALSEYIESIVVLDQTACEKKYDSPEVRSALLEVIEKYLEHPIPVIRAKVSLAKLSIPLHDYSRDKNSEKLNNFVSLVDKFAPRVFEDKASTARLCGIVMQLRRLRDWDGGGIPYCAILLKKMEESEDPEIQNMTTNFRERAYFEHLEINDLVARMNQEDKQVVAAIDEYFRAIDINPSVRSEFFQVAVLIIYKHKQLEQKKEYSSLLQRLATTAEKVSSEELKSGILKAIDKLESMPWGMVGTEEERVEITEDLISVMRPPVEEPVEEPAEEPAEEPVVEQPAENF